MAELEVWLSGGVLAKKKKKKLKVKKVSSKEDKALRRVQRWHTVLRE